MQEMVKIFQYKIGDEEINSVNARELHKILESKQQFTDWIKRRLKDTQALENIDYTSFHKNERREVGATTLVEYIITLDLAKEFSMLEKNAKGKEIRQYFIQFERAARREIENFCKEIKRLTTEISNLREKIQILEDLVASSDRLISMYKKQLEAKTIDEDIRRLVRRKEQLKQEGYL